MSLLQTTEIERGWYSLETRNFSRVDILTR